MASPPGDYDVEDLAQEQQPARKPQPSTAIIRDVCSQKAPKLIFAADISAMQSVSYG